MRQEGQQGRKEAFVDLREENSRSQMGSMKTLSVKLSFQICP